MMRTTFAVAFVCALAACSSGGSGDDDGGGVDAPMHIIQCGDGVCDSSEIGHCQADCGVQTGPTCGDGQCTAPEDTNSCPQDCHQQQAMCGNGTCEAGEDANNCPGDCGGQQGGNCPADPNQCLFCALAGQMCPAGLDMNSCLTCIAGGGGGGGLGCVGGAPNGVCDPGEDANNCPFDCM